MYLKYGILALTTSLFAVQAIAGPFQVKAPQYWKNQSQEPQYTVYTNSRSPKNAETVTTLVFTRASQNDEFQANLHTVPHADLAKVRNSYMRTLGITNYTVLDIKKVELPKSKFKFMQVIQSRFRDLKGREVQMLERQYISGRRMFVVSYLVDDVALNDRPRAERALDFFKPAESGREPAASEVVGAQETQAPQQEEKFEPEPGVKYKDLDMTKPENVELCRTVDESVRRKPTEDTFVNFLADQLKIRRGCVIGVAQNLWGVITMPFKFIGWLDQVTSLGKSEARDQAIATVSSVAAEIKKDPAEFAMKIVNSKIGAALNEYNVWGCYTNEEKARKICEVAANLIPTGLFFAALAKGPMSVADALKMKNIVRETMEKDPKAAKNTTPPKTEDAKEVAQKADGKERSSESESGVGVKVTDSAREPSAPTAAAPAKAASADAPVRTLPAPAKIVRPESVQAAFSKLDGDQAKRLDQLLSSDEKNLTDQLKEIIKLGKTDDLGKLLKDKNLKEDKALKAEIAKLATPNKAEVAKAPAPVQLNPQAQKVADSIDTNQELKNLRGYSNDSAREALRTAAAKSATGETNAGDYLKALAYNEGSPTRVRSSLMRTKGLTDDQRERIGKDFDAANFRVTELRKSYGDLVDKSGEDLGELYRLLDQAEKNKISAGKTPARAREEVRDFVRSNNICTPK